MGVSSFEIVVVFIAAGFEIVDVASFVAAGFVIAVGKLEGTVYGRSYLLCLAWFIGAVVAV